MKQCSLIPAAASSHLHSSYSYWESINWCPFVNEVFPIRLVEHTSLVDSIREMIAETMPAATYSNADILAVCSGSGMNATHILSFPTSIFMQAITDESPKELHVLIDWPVAGGRRGGECVGRGCSPLPKCTPQDHAGITAVPEELLI